MAEKSWPAIRLAAKGCLVRCLESDSPMASMDSYLAALACIGWDDESILEVESAVLESLMYVVQSESYEPREHQAVG